MSSKALFISGTDTDAGKTVVSAALVLALRNRGLDVGYIKPLATEGLYRQGRLMNRDALMIKDLAGLSDSMDVINPYCLKQPLSPLAAGRLEGVSLDLDDIRQKTRQSLGAHDLCIIEGAGGLLVPIAPGATFLDLMAELGHPALLAARPGLGTINHSLLSLGAMKRRGVEAIGFCFSKPEERLKEGARNSDLINEFSKCPFLGSLPFIPQPARAEEFIRAAEESLALDRLVESLGW